MTDPRTTPPLDPDGTPTGAVGPHTPGTDERLVTGEVAFGDDAEQSGYKTLTEEDDKEAQRRPGDDRD